MGNLVGQKDLMTTLFSAFAGFSAFGAAIVAFLAAGGALQSSSDWLRQHGVALTAKLGMPGLQRRAQKEADRVSTGLIVLTGAIIAVLVVLPSGLGLLSSFTWLHADASGTAQAMSWAYTATVFLFWWEAIAITAVTIVVVVLSAASSALPASSQPKSQAAPGQSVGPQLAADQQPADAKLRSAG